MKFLKINEIEITDNSERVMKRFSKSFLNAKTFHNVVLPLLEHFTKVMSKLLVHIDKYENEDNLSVLKILPYIVFGFENSSINSHNE